LSVYTATDSPVHVEVDTVQRPPTAQLTHRRRGEQPALWVNITAGTPDPVQLMILYAALNADTDPTAAIGSAATALGVPPEGNDQASEAGS
jgi:hypothetical protein